ncbi:MAG: T9SS type A sorting domain-containing protein [Bacteroidales bacterium]|nr:T9SS type A sorting domain-containing protein [Bacteroidales bacterium]
MKNILLILICLFGLNAFAQQNHDEIAPNINVNPNAINGRDSINLQFSFPCIAFAGEYGVNTDGTDIFVTQWYGNLFARYDEFGVLHDTFSIPGVSHIRDLAYDGQYYYGSPFDSIFYILDLDNKVLIDVIHTSFQIRGMTYDPDSDALWASECWSPMFYKMDIQGNILDSWLPSGITLDIISGLSYDNNSPDGPFLWGFSQDSTGAIIIKYDIPNQSQTGNMIDVSTLATSGYYAGGLFIRQMELRSEMILGGMIQNDLVFALELGYANQLVDIESNEMLPSMEIYPNPVQDILNLSISSQDQELSCRILNQTGQIIQDHKINVNSSSDISFNTSMLEPGVYFIQISSNKGYSIAKKFLKIK